MENVDSEVVPSTSADANANVELTNDFFNTGRAGRRNALPDILSSHATISTADLPDQLDALTTTDSKPSSAASSSNLTLDAQPTPSTSQIAATSNSWRDGCQHVNYVIVCVCGICTTIFFLIS